MAARLRGKLNPVFSPSRVDTGDWVVIVNAGKIKLTGRKWDNKCYYRHSGYMGGLKTITARRLFEKTPEDLLRIAVRGMLPKNRLGREFNRKLKVYAGPQHPHAAQNPEALDDRLKRLVFGSLFWSFLMNQENVFYATGKRKSAVARTWIRPGTGLITINGRPMDKYFHVESARKRAVQALLATELLGSLDAKILVAGGGWNGQAGAVSHGITKALLAFHPEFRSVLKKAGFITRDPRVKERKKYGRRRPSKVPVLQALNPETTSVFFGESASCGLFPSPPLFLRSANNLQRAYKLRHIVKIG